MRVTAIFLFILLASSVVPSPAPSAEPGAAPPHAAPERAAADAHAGHEQMAMQGEAQAGLEVGVDERLGEKVPLDTALLDEQGRRVRLGAAITKPTLLLPVYYSCPTICTTMLANLAQALNRVPLDLGEEYGVLAVSFDEEEGPETALQAKRNYTKILKEGLPREEWRFLTGDKENIRSLMDGIGFKFKRTAEHLFIHPSVLVALAPDGTIIRYLYGPSFLPFDIGMALTEAQKGTPGLSVRKLLTYCFDYDPESKSYLFRSFRFLALGILLVLLAFFFFLLRRGPSRS